MASPLRGHVTLRARLVRALGPARPLPLGARRRLGVALAEASRLASPALRRRAEEALHDARPDWDEARRAEIIRRSFRELGRTAADVVAVEAMDDVALCRRLHIEGLETLAGDDGPRLVAVPVGTWELVERAAAIYLDGDSTSQRVAPAVGYGADDGFRIEITEPVAPDDVDGVVEAWIDAMPDRVAWMDEPPSR